MLSVRACLSTSHRSSWREGLWHASGLQAHRHPGKEPISVPPTSDSELPLAHSTHMLQAHPMSPALSSPWPWSLRDKQICEGFSGCLKNTNVKNKKKWRQGGEADSLTGTHTINTPKITISAEQRLPYPDPQETQAALTIGRNSDSLQIFSSPACSCRLFHFTLLNIKPSKHFHLSVLDCQSNYPFVTTSNRIGITYFPGQF